MGAIFKNAPIEPTVVAIEVDKIFYAITCCIRLCGAPASTNIRPIDAIGRPQGNLDVCSAHATQLIERARIERTSRSPFRD